MRKILSMLCYILIFSVIISTAGCKSSINDDKSSIESSLQISEVSEDSLIISNQEFSEILSGTQSSNEQSSNSQHSSSLANSQKSSNTNGSSLTSRPTSEIPNPILDSNIADKAILLGVKNNEFPIGLWNPTRYDQLNENVYKDIKDSYYNFAVDEEACYGGIEMMLKNFDYAQKYGIKLFINEPKIRAMNSTGLEQKITDMVAPYKNHAAFIGNVFVDEPDKTTMDKMLSRTKEYEKQLPGKYPYINLLPDYATETQTGFMAWADYIDYYLTTYKPKYVSYDYYPLMKENKYMGFGFTKSLNEIAKIAQKHQVPLWTTLQSVPASLTGRPLTKTDISWQMYMNLAFGVKGLTYWIYATGTEHNEIPDALIDRSGNKTNLWQSVKEVNKEITNFSKILLTLNYKGVMLHTAAENSFSYALESFSPVKKVDGGEYIVGCLEDSKGNKKLMIVNLGIIDKAEVRITIDRTKSNYYHIWDTGVRKAAWLPNDNVINVTLDPGEGQFIELGGVG